MYLNNFIKFFLNKFLFLKHRLQLEEQLRQQLDNQRRVEEMHALESINKTFTKFENFFFY
jgi:hypothetical protein